MVGKYTESSSYNRSYRKITRQEKGKERFDEKSKCEKVKEKNSIKKIYIYVHKICTHTYIYTCI